MISTRIDLGGVDTALAALSRGIKDRANVNRKIAVQLYGLVIEGFETEGRSNGRPWAPLKAGGRWKGKGRNRYFQDDAKILQDTGNLRNSFAPFSSADVAGVGARASQGVDYAEVHELGSPERNIPARPMLPPSERALKLASDIYGMHLSAEARKAGLTR